MITLLIISIFLMGIGFLIKWILKKYHFNIKYDSNIGLKFLLTWIIIGFVTRLDYTEAWGSIIKMEPIFEPINILFSTLSFGIIFLAFRTPDVKIKKLLLGIELTYWIAKLMTIKGGYVVGILAMPDISIVFFDMVSILVRLLILSQLIKIDTYTFTKVGIIGFLILGLKISNFPIPLNMIYEEKIAFKKAQIIRKDLIGNWRGKIIEFENNEVKYENLINIQIDSTHIYLDSIEGLQKNYKLILDYPDYGSLSNSKEYSSSYNLIINERNNDSLIMTIDNILKKYEFRLKKNR